MSQLADASLLLFIKRSFLGNKKCNEIAYDGSGTFHISLNLSRCALDHTQADQLSTAMSVFRAENC